VGATREFDLHFDFAGGFTDPEGIGVVPPPVSSTFPLEDSGSGRNRHQRRVAKEGSGLL